MKVVILAGGKGTRLKPYTTSFPKPLMPISDKPILEIVMKYLSSQGLTDIVMAVGHLAELVVAFLGDGSKFGVKIEYSREDKPLGTMGPIKKLGDKLSDTFIVMNGDVLTDMDIKKLTTHHKKTGSICTIALNKRVVDVDLGVVELDDAANIVGWKEKPKIDYLVSMGIYVFNKGVLDYIPENKKFDLPELVIKLVESGEKVSGYVFDGYWLDIGRPEDYEKACSESDRILSSIYNASKR